MFTYLHYIKDEGGKVWRAYQKEAKLFENKKKPGGSFSSLFSLTSPDHQLWYLSKLP